MIKNCLRILKQMKNVFHALLKYATYAVINTHNSIVKLNGEPNNSLKEKHKKLIFLIKDILQNYFIKT